MELCIAWNALDSGLIEGKESSYERKCLKGRHSIGLNLPLYNQTGYGEKEIYHYFIQNWSSPCIAC